MVFKIIFDFEKNAPNIFLLTYWNKKSSLNFNIKMAKSKYILFFNQIGIAIDQVGVKCFAWWTIQSIESYWGQYS
jgi:hypothetical protein